MCRPIRVRKPTHENDTRALIWINILDRNLNVVGGGQYTVSKFENFARTFPAKPGYYASVSMTSDDNTITYCGGGSEILS